MPDIIRPDTARLEDMARRAGAGAFGGYVHNVDARALAWAIAEINRLRAKLKDARNRLDSIRETNREIHLDYDIERIDAVLSNADDGNP